MVCATFEISSKEESLVNGTGPYTKVAVQTFIVSVLCLLLAWQSGSTTTTSANAMLLNGDDPSISMVGRIGGNTRSVVTNIATANDWPQVQNNPQRTGFTPETLGTNFRVAWTHPFQPERIYPQVQAVIYQGKVFVGTEMGNLYALNATTGAQAWRFQVGAPILASVAAGNGLVFFGAMDGAIYAVDASTGMQAWKTALSWRLGFSTAPLFADNKVMLGGRNGIFYALDPADGHVIWQYNAGAPIVQTAAWDNNRAFFGTMDMYVHAVNTVNGTPAWKSQRIPQMIFQDYWPVAYQGKVYIRAMGHGELASSDLSDGAQSSALAAYGANPGNFRKSLFVFDEATGQEAPAVIHWDTQTMNGATTPPCVDRDGFLIMPVPQPNSYQSGWGRLNPAIRKIVESLSDGTGAGYGNNDENLNVTCAQNMILSMHTEEYNANYTGAYNLNTHQWVKIDPGWQSGQMSSNTQGGGGNPASISNGMIYHISYHELIARATQ
jgi:outer membrane protein assembly factor BamB